MKKVLLLLFAFCLALGGVSSRAATPVQPCPNPPPGITVDCPPAIPDTGTFLANSYQDGLGEIQVSQFALQNNQDAALRAFAQQMIGDHSAVNKMIAQLAQQKKVALPNDLSDDQRTLIERLASAGSADARKLYADFNVSAHEAAVAEFHEQATQGTDPDIRAFAENNLPILEVHLIRAQLLDDGLNPAAFLAHVYQDGQAEVMFSQLALSRAANSEVKAFAQRMIDDHTDAGQKIQALAGQKNADLPSSLSTEQQATADKLSQMSGSDFDKAYMDVAVYGHIVDAQAFRVQATEGTDPDVKKFATDTLPTVSDHLQRAIAIDEALQPSFLFGALQDSTLEVQLSNLALLKSENPDVRNFAQTMIADHTKLNAQIVDLAQKKSLGISDLLSPRQKLLFVEMMRLAEPSFDQRYMTVNIFAHLKALGMFKQASTQVQDADIKAFAADALPMLTDHLNLATQVAQGLQAR